MRKKVMWFVGFSLIFEFIMFLQVTSTPAKVIGWGLWTATLIVFVLNIILERKLNKLTDN